MDPQLTSDGKPYGPIRYRQLVHERYLLAKKAHISYEESGKLTPTERNIIFNIMNEERKREEEELRQIRNARKR